MQLSCIVSTKGEIQENKVISVDAFDYKDFHKISNMRDPVFIKNVHHTSKLINLKITREHTEQWVAIFLLGPSKIAIHSSITQ